MKRRSLLGAALALPFVARANATPFARVRPGEAGWPSDAAWQALDRTLGGSLMKGRSALDVCRTDPTAAPCREVFAGLKNPYFIGDDPGLSQTTGWVDAWTSQPSAYVVAARTAADIAAAVTFARDNRLRLVVRGGGHSYLGTSNSPDSLMVWTHAMNEIVLHPSFVAQGCGGGGRPAVSVGAGALWMQTYNTVTTHGGRYVQGGGCGTVGVAGLVQGGGFGSYSKNYGLAAASLLEAEVVTADGVVRIANACTHSDLFWALKGGGGGTFGVVTRVTLATHDLPSFFGGIAVTIEARSDTAFRTLVDRFVAFYAERLANRHWGEIANVRPGRQLDIQMACQGLTLEEIGAVWQPFLDGIEATSDFVFVEKPRMRVAPARHRWDPEFIRTFAPGAIRTDDRPGASSDNIYWTANVSEAGHFIHRFESAWLPASLLQEQRRAGLVDALVAASRHSTVEIHFQKGLAGGAPEAIEAARDTAMNPAALDAFALAIVASEGPPAYPALRGHEPDMRAARCSAEKVRAGVGELRKLVPDAGAYVAESSYFQPDWQSAYWGSNYGRLRVVKQKYDPDGLFFVHHGVGSEDWSPDGFTKRT
jgi:FAD/FMN-containing dehydrogenase